MTELSFGALLRRYRMAAGLTQEELAERAGVSTRGISDLERGERGVPRLDTLRLLLRALDLSSADREALVAAARRPAAPPPQRDATAPSSELPVPLTPLIGREREIAAVTTLLAEPAVRLLSLTGPGGTGKTRLALAVAQYVASHFPDGVIFVPLAALGDPSLVASALAQRLGVREAAGQLVLERLKTHLHDKRMLLVLDNFEHLLSAAPLVTDLLERCLLLKVLVTSRIRLQLRGEREVDVPPLALPDPTRLPRREELALVPAVQLFIARGQDVNAGFSLTDENAPAVAEICQRLDGLPLALELAAARIKILSPAALLARLDPRLPLLTTGAQDLPDRQRTLRNTIVWSHNLLSLAEQTLFRRLGVFAGGWTIEAADAVACMDSGLDALEGISSLVDKNLVRQGEGSADEPRFTMLETIRELAVEHLAGTGEVDETRRRHARYFLHLAERLTPEIDVLESLEQRTQLVTEYDNLRLALQWFDTHDEGAALLRLTATLAGEWLARGLLREGLEQIEHVLGRTRDTVSAARVQLLHAAGVMALYQGNHDRAAPFFEESLAVAHDLGDTFLMGQSLAFSGWLSYRSGDYRRADEQLAEARQLLHVIPDSVRATLALIVSGDNAMAQEHVDQALQYYQQTIGLLQAGRYGWILGDAQSGLASAHYCRGDLGQATMLYAESLRRAASQNITVQLVSALVGLSAVAAATGQPEVGARLIGAAEGFADSIGARIFPRDLPVRQRALAALTTALGENKLATELEAGRSLTLEQAVAKAQAIIAGVDELTPDIPP